MYYYLFEPSVQTSEARKTRITSLINLHGITGEIASPSAIQGLEDLITKAADKGYNTIVAVGGDAFATQVAKLLARSDIALGIIPVESSKDIHNLIGVASLDQAILVLKQRRVVDTSIGVVSPGKVFLTSATIKSPNPTSIILESKIFRAEGTFTNLTIERGGQDTVVIHFTDRSRAPHRLISAAYWLIGRDLPDVSETILRSPIFTITTADILPVTIAEQEMAKTPCKVRIIPRALKLIKSRATLPET
jgi:hypothetical protein